MTLLDAPKYNARRAAIIRNVSITLLVVLVVGAVLSWFMWDWPEEHRVNRFFAAVEASDMQKAYGIWNHDDDWQQHPDRYKPYDFTQFQKDWGISSDYGKIHSHRIIMAKTVGNGVVMGLDINGGKTPIFLRVDHSTKQIGFSPVELYVGP
ncbi:hypothetical protein [Paracidobacterium acidisoli]|uniref:Uncharacterized protein n=1 Tax=Paracidobacterium acidisoli TaxID=2303751 RepID=A0A372IMR5_9BACT|nr:hypothetical protein [Paracidobacterium acidisoli]MBT9331673.1 hypothetical protein [Paracidobacterium acidisoli]